MRAIIALLTTVFALLALPAQASMVAAEQAAPDQPERVARAGGSGRLVENLPPALQGDGFYKAGNAGADYGPFRVADNRRAQLIGITDENTPAQFAAMLRDYPQIAILEMIDCPGTYDDRANLRLGRMIRNAGLATHVPTGGSVRSGAVELFIAGVVRQIDDGAQFAVHAWLDEDGRQATDYSAVSPENRKYLAFYREMGMAQDQARDFYAMTNSVPFENARWLDAWEMREWIQPEKPAAPQLAYLDLGPLLN